MLKTENERIAQQIADLTAVHNRLTGLIAAGEDPLVCRDHLGQEAPLQIA